MKVKINNTPLFKQVASVIGERAAFIEIGKLKLNDLESFEKPLNKAVRVWKTTPQGFNFWYAINQGVNPIKVKR